MDVRQILRKKGKDWSDDEIEAVFAWLIDEELSRLVRLAYGITRDLSLAEDAVQDGFFNAWRGLQNFDPARTSSSNCPFRTWIGVIVLNAARKIVKGRIGYIDWNENLPIYELIDWDKIFLLELVWDCVERLDPLYREALILVYKQGLSLNEAAQQSSPPCSYRAMKMRLFRARQKLVECLKRKEIL